MITKTDPEDSTFMFNEVSELVRVVVAHTSRVQFQLNLSKMKKVKVKQVLWRKVQKRNVIFHLTQKLCLVNLFLSGNK